MNKLLKNLSIALIMALFISIINGCNTTNPPESTNNNEAASAGTTVEHPNEESTEPAETDVTVPEKSTQETTLPLSETQHPETDTLPATTENTTPTTTQPQQTTPPVSTTTPPSEDTEETAPSTEETTPPTENVSEDDIQTILSTYSGRWYLSGYADVCIDVSKSEYGILLTSYNFAFPGAAAPGYAVYPGKNYESWVNMIEISPGEGIENKNIILRGDSITIGGNVFVRGAGSIDRYTGTCYKAALGTWYLEGYPNSTITILTNFKAQDLDNSDTFLINTEMFDFNTLSTFLSAYPAGSGRADRKEDWDRYGISVSGGVLTVSNSVGVRYFYREPIYQKVSSVSLSETTVNLTVGESSNIISVTITPGDAFYQNVEWTISDTSVATFTTYALDAHVLITAQNEGTAVLTATSPDGPSASCTITVVAKSTPPDQTDPPEVQVSGIALDRTTLDLYLGSTQKLCATITPENASNTNVIWESNDASVVQVATDGTVTAVGTGTATITATTEDGGYTATCQVNVQEEPLSVAISMGIGYYMSDSGSVAGVFVEATPSGGSGNYVEYNIKLYKDGEYIGEVNSDSIVAQPIASGTYTAEVYVKDSNGNEVTATKTTTISV